MKPDLHHLCTRAYQEGQSSLSVTQTQIEKKIDSQRFCSQRLKYPGEEKFSHIGPSVANRVGKNHGQRDFRSRFRTRV